jgi:4-alpha-glucanotransferase
MMEKAFESFLDKCWRCNNARARKFREWTKTQASWIEGYALFRTLMDENGGSEMWDTWPQEQQTQKSAAEWLKKQKQAHRKRLESRMRFFQYVQWIAFSQWQKLKAHCEAKNVALMGDVP